jgi:hypothetical protein
LEKDKDVEKEREVLIVLPGKGYVFSFWQFCEIFDSKHLVSFEKDDS